jgi:hypothetical protein
MRAGRVERMRRIWIYAIGLSLAALSSASVAFEEQKLRPAQPSAATGSGGAGAGVSVQVSDPGVAVPRVDSGTKIRVPGLGVIGEIPKMDFGLELLYGATQPKPSDTDRNEGNGVMGRVTVPIKPSR